MGREYCVYILTNKSNHVLYTGVTGDLATRIEEHRGKVADSFTSRYNVTKLVYYGVFDDPLSAITREKQIKGGSRQKKIDLIRSLNPEWKDLSSDL